MQEVTHTQNKLVNSMLKLSLKSLKKHLYVIKRLSGGGRKFTIRQDGVRCHTANSVTNYLNENVRDYVRKENWPPNSCDLSPIDNAICDMMEKMFYKNVKRYEDIKGLSPVISDAWDRLKKNHQ